MTVSSRAGRRTTLALLAAAAVAAGRPVNAQGTSGTLPDPISSRDLVRYADQLDLTDQQRQAIEPFQEQYRNDFRILRETEIAEYLENVGGLWARGMRGLDPEAIKDSLDRMERVTAKIRLLDETLFSQIQSVLTDQQIEALPRAIQQRQRQRYQTGSSRMVSYGNRAARVDLSRLYEDLDLTDEEHRVADPLVLQYEQRLTAATRELYEASTRIFLDVAEALAEQMQAMADAAENGDRQAMRGVRQAMSDAWSEASRKPREMAAKIGDLNLATLRQLAEALPQDQWITLRSRYLRRAYPEVPAGPGAAAHGIRLARKSRNLSRSMQADIDSTETQFRTEWDSIVDQMVHLIDDHRREAEWSPMRRGDRSDARREYDQKLADYKQRLLDLDERTLAQLLAIVGPDQAGALKTAVAQAQLDGADDDPAAGPGAGGDARAASGGAPGAAASEPDAFLPPPITTRDVLRYRRRLELDETDRFILESLYDEYWSAYKRVAATDVRALDAAKSNLPPERPPGPEGDRDNGPAASVEQIDEIYGLRGRALESIQALDGGFFDDLETMVSSDEQMQIVRRLRLARERDVYNRGLDGGLATMFGGRWRRRDSGFERQSQESDVDLVAVVESLDLPDEDRAKADKLLADYETGAVDGFRLQYERIVQLRRRSERLRAQPPSPQGEEDRDRRRSRFEGFRRLMEEEGRLASEARKSMIELNRATLQALRAALQGEQAEALVDAYNTAAFPMIFEDPQSAGRYLSAALDLTDLAEGERSKIESIAAEYRPADNAVAMQLVELYAAADDELGTGFDRSRWRAYQERSNRLESLLFDRTEINAKALRQLRGVLTDRQQALIRLPHEVESDEDETS